jgi:hypothetical protein
MVPPNKTPNGPRFRRIGGFIGEDILPAKRKTVFGISAPRQQWFYILL